MSVLLIRRRRPTGEPDGIVDGTGGAGRLCQALLELGVPLDGVRQAVIDPDAPIATLAGIDAAGPFDRVVLGSHLVNNPDAERRAAFVRLAARHVGPAGSLLVEHHPLDWAETAADVEPTPGSSVGMESVRREPPFVSAVSVYDVGGRNVRQPFQARVLTEAELAGALAPAGFEVRRRLGPTWIEALRPTIGA